VSRECRARQPLETGEIPHFQVDPRCLVRTPQSGDFRHCDAVFTRDSGKRGSGNRYHCNAVFARARQAQ
jgi:hypothetical protein